MITNLNFSKYLKRLEVNGTLEAPSNACFIGSVLPQSSQVCPTSSKGIEHRLRRVMSGLSPDLIWAWGPGRCSNKSGKLNWPDWVLRAGWGFKGSTKD